MIQALYEDKGIFNMCNRNLDVFVQQQGGDNVYIPAMPLLTAVTPPDTNRKDTKADTNMVQVPMAKSVVEVGEEVEMRYMNKSGSVMQGFVVGVAKAHRKNFDAQVIAEAQGTTTTIPWDGGQISYGDFANISGKFNELEVDPDDRFVVYPARLESQLNKDPDIKRAMTYSPSYLENGIFRMLNMQIISSARVAKIGGKENLVGIWGPGLAFVLDAFMDYHEVYDDVNKRTLGDYFAWYGKKLYKNEYAIVSLES